MEQSTITQLPKKQNMEIFKYLPSGITCKHLDTLYKLMVKQELWDIYRYYPDYTNIRVLERIEKAKRRAIQIEKMMNECKCSIELTQLGLGFYDFEADEHSRKYVDLYYEEL